MIHQKETEAGPSTSTLSSELSHLSLDQAQTTFEAETTSNANSKSKNKDRKTKTKSKPTTTINRPRAPKPVPRPIEAFTNPAEGEEETVHEIYESIAPHFAQTRHKPWPLITSFLNSLPPNSLGLDSGAGNGKYLPTAASAGHTMIALDRSLGLLEHAKEQEGGLDIIRGDLGCRGWRDGVFDFTISVAAIHHLSTPIRRRQAVQALLPALKLNSKAPYSRFFIYVWAYEQGDLSKRRMGVKAATVDASTGAEYEHEAGIEGGGSIGTEGEDGRDRGVTVGDERQDKVDGEGEKIQDVLVPWVLRSKPKPKPKPTPKSQSKSRSRSSQAAQSSTNPDEAPEATDEKQEGGEQGGENETNGMEEEEETEKVFNRYYHLFTEGELRDLIYEAGKEEGYRILPSIPSTATTNMRLAMSDKTTTSSSTTPESSESVGADEKLKLKWLRIRGEGWEADNWWVEAEVGVGEGL